MRIGNLIILSLAAALAACENSGRSDLSLVVSIPAVEIRTFDPLLRPQDDFYRWVNRPWMRSILQPLDLGSYGAFLQVAETVEERLLSIVTEIAQAEKHPAGSDEEQIKALFLLYTDRVQVQFMGTKFLLADYQEFWRVENPKQMLALVGRRLAYGLSAPIEIGIRPDAGGSGKNVLYLSQSGLGLPDRDYYLASAPSARGVEILEAYEKYVGDVFLLLELDQAAKRARSVIEIERELAAGHWDSVDGRDRIKTFNPHDLEALKLLSPQFDWPLFFAELRIDAAAGAVIQQPSFVALLARMTGDFSAAEWSDYFLFHLVNDLAQLLPDAVSAARFEAFGRALRGQVSRQPPADRIVGFLNRTMGPALGRLYVEKHFSEADKRTVKDIAHNIKAGFRKRLEGNSWMSAKTRQAALRKLERMRFRVGYGDRPPEDEGFDIAPGSLIRTVLEADRARMTHLLKRLGLASREAPVSLLPQTVGANYEAFTNIVNIPAGILQAPFFEAGREPGLNYGAIGGIIGHEIIHGFDDQGRKSDESGGLRDWWSAKDVTEFSRLSEQLVRQYSGLVPGPGLSVDGRRTLSENIGDLGGLVAALEGLRQYRAGRVRPESDSREAERRFFIGWGRIWRRVYTAEELRRRLLSDPHALAEYRVNAVLQNLSAFHLAFDVRPGDPMWRPPEERITIW